MLLRSRFLIPLFSLFFLVNVAVIHYLKEGFWGFEIQHELPSVQETFVPPQEEPFNQPYYYIGKGCQSYVFESLDKKYVLKFFKKKHLSDPIFLKKMSFIPFLKPYISEKCARRVFRRSELSNSLVIAEKYLKAQGALVSIYLPMNFPFQKKAIVFDRIGWQHTIDLNNTPFILQKKAVPLASYLRNLAENHENEKVVSLIDSIKELLQSCVASGVVDVDRAYAFVQNTAYLTDEKRVILMDVGKFSKISELTKFEPEEYISKRLLILQEWTRQKLPSLFPYLECKNFTKIKIQD